MLLAILVAAVLVVTIFAALLGVHITMANRLKEEYDRSLASLIEHPENPELKSSCVASGLSYYRFMRIKDHASFMDFPMPYVDTPEIDQELVERDISEHMSAHPPAA